MNLQHQSIQTKNGEVNIGGTYVYTEYKFPGAMYGIPKTSYKFIVKVLNVTETENHINVDAEIIKVLISEGNPPGVGKTFKFSINKTTELMLWDLKELEED